MDASYQFVGVKCLPEYPEEAFYGNWLDALASCKSFPERECAEFELDEFKLGFGATKEGLHGRAFYFVLVIKALLI